MRRLSLAFLALPLFAQEAKTVTRPSGLKIEVLAEGTSGTAPAPGDLAKVHYTGWLADGTKFDSSLDRNQPLDLVVGIGMVIDGWDEAIPLMNVGGKCKLHVPAALGYGEAGFPAAKIPPKADLVFEIELLGVTKGVPPPAYRPADPAKQQTVASGLKWEMLEEGSGETVTAKDLVELRCTTWKTDGKMVFSSAALGGPVVGEASRVRILRTGERFLPEAVLLMKQGGKLRLEVPPELCWGKKKIVPRLEADMPTVWQVDLERVIRFAPLDPAKTRKTESGLEYEVIREGTGATPGPDSQVAAYCTGWTEDGKEFRSSHRRGTPEALALTGVIKGWTEGLQLMKEGGICRFRVPGKLAEGMAGAPPNTTLVFEIEMLRVLK